MKFIIIGAGDVGLSLSDRLTHQGHEVILIEKNESIAQRISTSLDLQVMVGNGASPETLVKAGLATADYLLAVADVDEVNIAACLVGKLVSPETKRIARIRQIDFEHSQLSEAELHQYFDLVINPDQAGADYLLQLLGVSGARDVLEFADGRLRVLAFPLGEGSELAGQTLESVRSRRSDFPFVVIAVVRNEELYVPHGGDTLAVDDLLYVIVPTEHTKRLMKLFAVDGRALSRVMIWGETPLSLLLAKGLEKSDARVKFIVSDPENFTELLDNFQNLLILDGEGTDQHLLVEENVGEQDVFIAASIDEEDNILSSLLAKKLGAGMSVALVNKATYLPLVSAIGVDGVVSSHLAAASAIFRHIHSGLVISDAALRQHDAGFIEIEVNSSFPFLQTQVKELKLPAGVLIAGIIRNGHVVIPGGTDTITIGDEVILFVMKSAKRKLQKLFNITINFLD